MLVHNADYSEQRRRILNENKRIGNKQEEIRYNEVKQKDPNAQKQVSMRAFNDDGTLSEKRVKIDIISKDGGNEVKGSESATYTPNQKSEYPKLERNGGVIVGKGKKPGYEGGTKFDSLKIKTTRPSGTVPFSENIKNIR